MGGDHEPSSINPGSCRFGDGWFRSRHDDDKENRDSLYGLVASVSSAVPSVQEEK